MPGMCRLLWKIPEEGADFCRARDAPALIRGDRLHGKQSSHHGSSHQLSALSNREVGYGADESHREREYAV